MAKETIEIAALGRPFRLGTLYDFRKDKIIPAVTLWDEQLLQEKVVEKKPSAECHIITSESADSMADSLKVDHNLNLSILTGLVQVHGAAKYLKQCKKLYKGEQVTLYYKCSTKTEQLTMAQLTKDRMQHPDVKCEATHVVTAITYGAHAFFLFDSDRRSSSEGSGHCYQGGISTGNSNVKILKPMLQQVVSNEVKAKIVKSKEELEKESYFTCTFIGDLQLTKNPTHFEEAIKVYNELPQLVGDGVPVTVYLYPLALLDPSFKLVQTISDNHCRKIDEFLKSLDDLEAACDELLNTETTAIFPLQRTEIAEYRKLLSQHRDFFCSQLTDLLPDIRGRVAEEKRLVELLRQNAQSPFNQARLESWISAKMQQLSIFGDILNVLPGIKVIQSDSEFNTTVSHPHQNCACLILCVPKVNQTLATMRDYLSTGNTDSCELNTLQQPEVRIMLQKVHLFKHYIQACENKGILFFIVERVSNKQNFHITMQCFQKGKEQTGFDGMPSEPCHPEVCETAANSVTVRWSDPEFGRSGVQGYRVLYRRIGEVGGELELTVSGQHTRLTIPELQAGTAYEVYVRAWCEFGEGPNSEIIQILTHSSGTEGSSKDHCEERHEGNIKNENRQEELTRKIKDTFICNSNTVEEGKLIIHKLNLSATVDKEDVKIRKYTLGKQRLGVPEKVVLMVGQTGAGKSTFINALVNYILGVQEGEPDRFVVIMDDKTRPEYQSQTMYITTYTFHFPTDFKVSYSLTIVDTPGMGSTLGLEHDNQMFKQIQTFFEMTGKDDGIDHLDAVAFVVKSSEVKLTATNKYIFDKILSMFSGDVKDNIFLICTFCDKKKPKVLKTVKAAKIPYHKYFKFNNSFIADLDSEMTSEDSSDEDSEGGDGTSWKKAGQNYEKFLEELDNVTSNSLCLTQQVLKEKKIIEELLSNAQEAVSDMLTKAFIVDDTKSLVKKAENEKTSVKLPEVKKLKIKNHRNKMSYNCTICEVTLATHRCLIPGTAPLTASFHNTICAKRFPKVVSNQCDKDHSLWSGRASVYKWCDFHYQTEVIYKERSVLSVKQQYESHTLQDLLNKLQTQYEELQVKTAKILQKVRAQQQRLDKISLRPQTHRTTMTYIDLLMETEKQETKDGWKERMEQLHKLKNNEKILEIFASSEDDTSDITSDPAYKELLKHI